MRKFIFCISLLMVLSLSGCEEGLTSNDKSLTEDEKFSFSKIHSDIKALKEEIKRLQQVNNEQEITIEALSGSSSSSIGVISERIDVLEGYVGGISVIDLKDTVDNLSYSVSDSWSGTVLSTTSRDYQYIPGAPEIVLTDVKEGDVFLASLDATAFWGSITLLATSGAIEWFGSSPTLLWEIGIDVSPKSAMGIFRTKSNGTIVIRMHMKSDQWLYDKPTPIYATQGSVFVSKLGG